MRRKLCMIVGLALVLGIAVSTAGAQNAGAQNIECSKIGTAYDELFLDNTRRVEQVQAEFKALPAIAPPQQREDTRRKFCVLVGELIGLYKFVGALANDCSSQGASNTELRSVIDKQRSLAEQTLKKVCE